MSDGHPQNKNVATYCPGGVNAYQRHVCGTGAATWKGDGSVQYGPHQSNEYLANDGGHCSCCCDCNSITVECFQGNTVMTTIVHFVK